MNLLTDSTCQRFWEKVNRTDDCWLWTASTNSKGYGKLWDGERITAAHRFSFELHFGAIAPGLFVLHRCDNRACVRPDHLFLGTQLDNMRDMVAKGRGGYTGLPGVRNHKAKLSPEQVEEIRRRFDNGELRSSLADNFGMCWSSIDRIVRGQYWPGVGEPTRIAA